MMLLALTVSSSEFLGLKKRFLIFYSVDFCMPLKIIADVRVREDNVNIDLVTKARG